MRDWKQESFPLSRSLVREVFRDAAALIGKAASNANPTTFCNKTIDDLDLDRPELPQRPGLQRRMMFYNVQILLNLAGTWVLAQDFPESGWREAAGDTVLNEFVSDVLTNQREL